MRIIDLRRQFFFFFLGGCCGFNLLVWLICMDNGGCDYLSRYFLNEKCLTFYSQIIYCGGNKWMKTIYLENIYYHIHCVCSLTFVESHTFLAWKIQFEITLDAAWLSGMTVGSFSNDKANLSHCLRLANYKIPVGNVQIWILTHWHFFCYVN